MTTHTKTLSLALFHAKTAKRYASAITKQINREVSNYPQFGNIEVTAWDQGFFSENASSALKEFFRQLHAYDGAILLMNKDEISDTDQSPAEGAAYGINPNLLLEVGACLAKFGTARTFLVMPKGDKDLLPSYFRSNSGVKVIEFDPNKAASNDAAIVGLAVQEILDGLGDIGDKAFFSDLPSYGLASGYVYNFLTPLCEGLSKNGSVTVAKKNKSIDERVEKEEPSKVDLVSYKDFRIFVRAPANEIIIRSDLFERIDEFGWGEYVLEVPDGRDIVFFADKNMVAEGKLHIVEVPTNLRPSLDAIEVLQGLWFPEQTSDQKFEHRLRNREIRNFVRYVDILLGGNRFLTKGQKAKISVEFIDDLDVVTKY